MKQAVDDEDVQGLVRYGYGSMKLASYALVWVKNMAAAQAWLRSAPITTAVKLKSPPKTALNIAFTAPGLRAIGIPESVIEGFSHEFRAGMAQESRARQLGDVGLNAPEHWQWGRPAEEPHALVMFFGEIAEFETFVQSQTGAAWHEAFESVRWLPTVKLDRFEPFGFADGISQPKPDWDQKRAYMKIQFDYTNEVALGEFLLGYPNEYGKLTERPLLEADTASAGLLPAEEAPGKKDLGRNGTYLVMRQLEQDVPGFWKFVDEQSGGDAVEAAKLAAAMVGRTKEGDPLVPIQDEAIPGIAKGETQNHFTFDGDPSGARCPFGAHVRRANPRNSDFPNRPASFFKKILTMLGFGPNGFRDDLMSSVRFHRLLRRGRKYGEATALAATPRGLYFICLNANISRQFEFLQNAWMNSTKFSGLTGESDPLLGQRGAIPGCPVTSSFTMQADGGLRRRIAGLPQFVTVRGGAYFFLPSLRALRYFAGEAGAAIRAPLR